MTRALEVVQACKPHTLPPQLQQKTRAIRPVSVCGFIYTHLKYLLHNYDSCICMSYQASSQGGATECNAPTTNMDVQTRNLQSKINDKHADQPDKKKFF